MKVSVSVRPCQQHDHCMQIVNMSSGLASKANLAANIRGEGLYQMAAKMGLAYRTSKAALCMGKPLFPVAIQQPEIR